jgi:hypothetical protein
MALGLWGRNNSTEKNPINVYSAAGQFNVSLTVTNLMDKRRDDFIGGIGLIRLIPSYSFF